jgi:pyocin large subunit-like protein
MSTALLRTMGELGGQDTEKEMVSPEAALPTTAGNEPGPVPEQVVTVSAAAPATAIGSPATEKVTTVITKLATTSRGMAMLTV